MGAQDKADILDMVANSGLSRYRALGQLGLSRSTHYRWLRSLSEGRLEDDKGGSHLSWNKIRLEEEYQILFRD